MVRCGVYNALKNVATNSGEIPVFLSATLIFKLFLPQIIRDVIPVAK